MKDWKTVTGTQINRPEEIDRSSSPTTVYLRRNIEQVDSDDGDTPTWRYEEKEMTHEEYENMQLMTQIVAEQTSGIIESVTEFQRDSVIDDYTAQLIEEGLI